MMNDPIALIWNENIGQTSDHIIPIDTCDEVAFCSLFFLLQEHIYFSFNCLVEPRNKKVKWYFWYLSNHRAVFLMSCVTQQLSGKKIFTANMMPFDCFNWYVDVSIQSSTESSGLWMELREKSGFPRILSQRFTTHTTANLLRRRRSERHSNFSCFNYIYWF